MSISTNNSFDLLRSISNSKKKINPQDQDDASLISDSNSNSNTKLIKKPKIQEKKDSKESKDLEPNAFAFIPNATNTKISPGKDVIVIALAVQERLYFQGRCLIVPLNGMFHLNGYSFFPNDIVPCSSKNEWIGFPCFCPQWTTAPFIQAVNANTNPPFLGLKGKVIVNHLLRNQIMNLLDSWADGPRDKVLVAFVELKDTGIQESDQITTNLNGFYTFPCNQYNPWNVEWMIPLIYAQPDVSLLDIPVSWNSISYKHSQYCILGQKNSGKSTLCRFMLNQLLHHHSQVAFLECDVGQTEFTPPGLVSLNLVSDPILDFPFTHLQTPIRSYYIGTTTPKHDPDFYLACINELYQYYIQYLQKKDIPLVINTQGWIKGMGFDILSLFVKNLKDSVEYIVLGNRTFSVFDSLFESMDPNRVCRLQVGLQSKTKLNSADYRALALSCYLQRESRYNEDERFTMVIKWNFTDSMKRNVYKVAWEKVRLKLFNQQVPISQILYAFNGSVVGLIIDNSNYPERKSNHKLQIIPNQVLLYPQIHECVGLGLIVKIDMINECFYIQTPVHINTLSRVNLLVKGMGDSGVDIPIRLRSNHHTDPIPYTSIDISQGLGSFAKKVRSIQRNPN